MRAGKLPGRNQTNVRQPALDRGMLRHVLGLTAVVVRVLRGIAVADVALALICAPRAASRVSMCGAPRQPRCRRTPGGARQGHGADSEGRNHRVVEAPGLRVAVARLRRRLRQPCPQRYLLALWEECSEQYRGDSHDSTGVPPQLEEMRPIGTEPPSASWMSRPVSQQTAEKVFHACAPRAWLLARAHGSRQA